jgi:hypothetical protein
MTRRVRLRAIVGGVVVVLAGVGPTMAYQTEVQRYYESMKDICRTGVMPEMAAAWLQASQAMDAARDRNNFAGLKSPTDTWLDCFQSPGDGKE